VVPARAAKSQSTGRISMWFGYNVQGMSSVLHHWQCDSQYSAVHFWNTTECFWWTDADGANSQHVAITFRKRHS
jgi:hypothetical protein